MTSNLLLADEPFVIALDDRTGRFRQHLRSVALGLSGALLAELILMERLAIRNGAEAVTNQRPPADAVAHVTLDHVAAETAQHSLRTWVSFFARTSVERVGAREERTALVQQAQTHRFGRQDVRWVPRSSADVAVPAFRVCHLLQNERPHDVVQATLAGLVDATGLSRSVLVAASPRTVQYRDFVISTLPPDLAALIQATRSAVADTVLSHTPKSRPSKELPVMLTTPDTSTPSPSQLAASLARDRLGLLAVGFFVMSGIASLTVAAGVMPTAYAVTGLVAIPAALDGLRGTRRGIGDRQPTVDGGAGWAAAAASGLPVSLDG